MSLSPPDRLAPSALAARAAPARPPARPNERLRGILFLCAGALVFSLQDAVIKWVSGGYPLPQVLAIRALIGFAPLFLLLHLDGGIAGLRTRRPGLHLLRGALLLGAYACYYLAIAAIPLAEAVSLSFSAPLFIVALSGPFLGERVGLKRWLAVVAGFIGVLVICRPGRAAIDPAALLTVAGAVFYATAAVMGRQLGATARASVMAFYQNIVFLAGALAMGALAGQGDAPGFSHASLQFLLRGWVMPDLVDFLLIASTGIVASVASWCLTHAYRIAEANVVAPFEYSSIIWGVLWGLFIWGEVPTVYTFAGVLLIVGAGVYILRAAR
jgi:drug/metabolite transporter (DMT)-like permease